MRATVLALIDGQVVEAADLTLETLAIDAPPPEPPRALLLTVLSVDHATPAPAYAAVVAHALSLDADGRPTGVDLLRPLTELGASEQVVLRAALTQRSWGAWARAPQHVRALLGRPDPPLLLAEAARRLAIPLPTLASAAVDGRLPTIRAGDRHLLYLATVVEAQERGLLHLQRGRPLRRSAG